MKKFYIVEFLNLYRKLAKTRLILEDNFGNRRRNIMAQQDVLDYIRKTPHNSNVNVVKGMLNFEDGGGGSSDFSTAEVTVINNNSENSASINTDPVNEQHNSFFYNKTDGYFYVDDIEINIGETITLDYVFLGNYVHVSKISALTYNCSGGAELVSTTQFGNTWDTIKITDDCTITIS